MPVVPGFPGVYVQEIPASDHTIHGAPTAQTVFVDWFAEGPVDTVVPVGSFAEFAQTFGGLYADSEASYQVFQFFQNGGSSAFCLRLAPAEGAAWKSSAELAEALLQALTAGEASPLVNLAPGMMNLLCLPCTTKFAPDDAQRVVEAALALCQDRHAFYLIDIPPTAQVATPEAMAAWFQKSLGQTPYDAGAVYYPRLQMLDPLMPGTIREVGSSGTMAGLYAQIDGLRGVWKAPAGIGAPLDGVTPAHALTEAEIAVLQPMGVDCIRTFAQDGTVAWGARTVRGANALESDYRYVPVRRLSQYLENSLAAGLRWVVFEPNNETLWASIRLTVETFLQGLWRQGAMFGYGVRCDGSTTTPADVARGVVNVVVQFAPERPEEFVSLELQLLTATAG